MIATVDGFLRASVPRLRNRPQASTGVHVLETGAPCRISSCTSRAKMQRMLTRANASRIRSWPIPDPEHTAVTIFGGVPSPPLDVPTFGLVPPTLQDAGVGPREPLARPALQPMTLGALTGDHRRLRVAPQPEALPSPPTHFPYGQPHSSPRHLPPYTCASDPRGIDPHLKRHGVDRVYQSCFET